MPATAARRPRPRRPRWRCRCGSTSSPISAARCRGWPAGLSRLFAERRLHLSGLARGLPDPQDIARCSGAAARRSQRALAPRDRRALHGCETASRCCRGGVAPGRPGRRYKAGGRALRRDRSAADGGDGALPRGQARRGRQFRRKAGDAFRTPRKPAGAGLRGGVGQPRQARRGRHRDPTGRRARAGVLQRQGRRDRRRLAPAGTTLETARRAKAACSERWFF